MVDPRIGWDFTGVDPAFDILKPKPHKPMQLHTGNFPPSCPRIERRGFDVQLVGQLFDGQQHARSFVIRRTDFPVPL